MTWSWKRVVRALVPQVVLAPLIRRFFRVRWTGDYATWEEARAASSGYDAPAILARVSFATRCARDGRAAYDRDGATFVEPLANEALLGCLRRAAAAREGALCVLDFGGALGSVYWQHRRWLAAAGVDRWGVVEQPQIVAAGRGEFEVEHLRFYETIDACCAAEQPAVLLLSSVLPYVEEPHALLADLVGRGFTAIVIRRTGVVVGTADRLTVQHVPRRIYAASYPCWFLGRERLLGHFAADYKLRSEEMAPDGEGAGRSFRDFVFERTP